jgi:hypothetical protein
LLCSASSPTQNLDKSNIQQLIANSKIMSSHDGIMALEEEWKKIDGPNSLIFILNTRIFLKDGRPTCA